MGALCIGRAFLFPQANKGFKFINEGFKNYFDARTNKEAVFKLPISVAMGFCHNLGIKKSELLEKTSKNKSP